MLKYVYSRYIREEFSITYNLNEFFGLNVLGFKMNFNENDVQIGANMGF